jgi:hypothetical protein
MAVLLTNVICQPSDAYTNSNLYEKCKKFKKLEDTSNWAEKEHLEVLAGMSECAGYLHGIADIFRMGIALGAKDLSICIPQKGVKHSQLMKIYVKYIDKNPEILHEPAILGVLNAFKIAFPCR